MDRVFNGDYASNKLTAAILRLFLPRAGGTVSRNERLDCWLLAGLWLMIVISAITFITLSDKPVFDDIPNLRDVTRYSNDGVSMATLANHVNPAGPFAYIWIALIGA